MFMIPTHIYHYFQQIVWLHYTNKYLSTSVLYGYNKLTIIVYLFALKRAFKKL